MTNNKQFDCQQMFRHACAFSEVADMADEKFCHDTADIEWYTTPATVNSAFACEVYLKAILKWFDIQHENEHRIKILYSLLPNDVQEVVKLTVLNKYGRWTDNWGFEILDNVSNAFVEWRYSYEHDWSESAVMQIEYSFLTALRDALRKACCDLFFNMKWEKYKEMYILRFTR